MLFHQRIEDIISTALPIHTEGACEQDKGIISVDSKGHAEENLFMLFSNKAGVAWKGHYCQLCEEALVSSHDTHGI
jgi:hypothetical protein